MQISVDMAERKSRRPLDNVCRSSCRRGKRTFDCLMAAVLLLAAAPLIACIAIYIQARDTGPVFFIQRRVGYLGRRFYVIKLRTMRTDADESQHSDHVRHLIASNKQMIKLDAASDERLVPGAALIRKLGIDELPQLVNVLRGEMSLVGPRPCMPYEASALAEWQRARFNVRPGITGLWQVSGKNRTSFLQMLELDVRYAAEHNLWLDIYILLRTVPAVLSYLRD
jgi:lipopolysaccharide/colanic/teichoic acid biosynthesis glycosyltransferase